MLYSLSEDADLSFLGERELIQVAIGLYQVIFCFDQEVSISVEDRFEITSKSETWTWTPGAKNVAESLVALLGRVVEKVRVLPRSRVELAFSGGMQLVITPENHDYESYQITHAKDVFVV
jgi:hypothetical protein